MKLGKHEFDFKLDKAFFEVINSPLIADGDVDVTLLWERKETMMVANFSLKGDVYTFCDRCNDPISVYVSGDYRLVYKFGTDVSDDENLVILDPESIEVDLSEQLYELTAVSLPGRNVHPAGECNEEVMNLYDAYIVNANEPEPEDDEDWDDEDWDEEDEEWLKNQMGEDDEDEEDPDDGDDDDNDDDPKRPIDPRWAALEQLKNN